MCNIIFNEATVRDTFERRAQNDNVSLYHVDPIQVYRDLYAGLPVGGIKLHFIQKIKRAMLEEAFRNAFRERAKKEHRDLNQIGVWVVTDDVVGAYPANGLFPEQYQQARVLSQEVWYDMMIEEAQAALVSVV